MYNNLVLNIKNLTAVIKENHVSFKLFKHRMFDCSSGQKLCVLCVVCVSILLLVCFCMLACLHGWLFKRDRLSFVQACVNHC